MATVDELSAEHRRAYVALVLARNVMAKEYRERLDEFKRRLEAELHDKYGPGIRVAEEVERTAQMALSEEKSRLAKTGAGSPYPLGTKLCEWELDPSVSLYARYRPRVLSGRTAVVEAVTVENIGEVGKPVGYTYRAEVGSFIARILKKDGKPGKLYFDLRSGWLRDHWLPEGVRHPEAKKEG